MAYISAKTFSIRCLKMYYFHKNRSHFSILIFDRYWSYCAITFYGRLFCILCAIFGIPLYALFLKHAGECITDLNKKLIGWCHRRITGNKRVTNRNFKCIGLAFIETMATIFLGALGAYPFGWTYFEGNNNLEMPKI